MYLTRIGRNLTTSLLFNKKSIFAFTKSTKRHRDKFKLDYDYFSNIPLEERDEELERINSLRKLNVQFTKKIPYYPIN